MVALRHIEVLDLCRSRRRRKHQKAARTKGFGRI